MYDIENDKARSRVAKFCKQAGLYRVQYSVFLGTLDSNLKDTLELQIEQQIDEQKDKVYIFPIPKSTMKSCVLMGQAFDKKLVTDKIKALFF